MSRATVVLPDPDPPTMASDPPSGTVKPTPSTATSGPYSLRRFSTWSTGSGIGRDLELAEELGRTDAPRQTAIELHQRRPAAPANVGRVRASRGEGTGVWRRLESGERAAGDGRQAMRGGIDVRPR